MAEGKQRLETKQIQGQVITHTVIKPIKDGPPQDAPAPAESEDTGTASE
ncbi:hypothetical protein ACFXJO_22860 [Streptomyces lavendulae]|nr:hypothetical protein [Streptomyces sp. SPB4]MDH6543669.1 hypothetical protein [Streptomyces sp. SPB4]